MNARKIYYDHFASRLAERYGLIATDRLYNEFIRQIQNRNQPTRTRQINRQRTIHCVFWAGQPVFVVYRKNKAALITALPYNDRYRKMHTQTTREWLKDKDN